MIYAWRIRDIMSENRLKQRYASNLTEVLKRFGEWLYLEPPDYEFIEVAIAATLDREIPGDPIWIFLVGPSGATKTELIRSLSGYHRAYTLDLLTPKSLVSGQAEKDEETKELVPVAGILQDLDERILLLKDFTTVLSAGDETRTAIYGDLRSAYDGYLEKAFGTLREPIRVKSSFGLVAGVTPVIDKYTKMTGVLGERFLMIRQDPDRIKSTKRAEANTGKEEEMRAQLRGAVTSFIKTLEFAEVPTLGREYSEQIVKMACYVGYMRSRVFATYNRYGEIIDMDPVSPEVPTRVVKQLKKLAQLLAIIRGRKKVTEFEMKTIARVARDTCNQRRQRIMEVFDSVRSFLTLTDIAGIADKLYYPTVRNEVAIMGVLGILEQDASGRYVVTEEFRPFFDAIYTPYPLGTLIKAAGGDGVYVSPKMDNYLKEGEVN